eukprot:TRINITY_DN28959_c0_g1_i1.p1 TRINITY_DN28959_c0_g1~~TRINITY_DN28959_c0_g1_i1.p1  ORF type:complete len:364 (-),score=75.07 TRINITY_DN28959_c0_g1_i1:199-1290(-)
MGNQVPLRIVQPCHPACCAMCFNTDNVSPDETTTQKSNNMFAKAASVLSMSPDEISLDDLIEKELANEVDLWRMDTTGHAPEDHVRHLFLAAGGAHPLAGTHAFGETLDNHPVARSGLPQRGADVVAGWSCGGSSSSSSRVPSSAHSASTAATTSSATSTTPPGVEARDHEVVAPPAESSHGAKVGLMAHIEAARREAPAVGSRAEDARLSQEPTEHPVEDGQQQQAAEAAPFQASKTPAITTLGNARMTAASTLGGSAAAAHTSSPASSPAAQDVLERTGETTEGPVAGQEDDRYQEELSSEDTWPGFIEDQIEKDLSPDERTSAGAYVPTASWLGGRVHHGGQPWIQDDGRIQVKLDRSDF